jgi:hypothetical protein
MAKRRQLLDSALKFGQAGAVRSKGAPPERPLEALTNFRPFTIRELDFDVWDHQENNAQVYRGFQDCGIMKGDSSYIGNNQGHNVQPG